MLLKQQRAVYLSKQPLEGMTGKAAIDGDVVAIGGKYGRDYSVGVRFYDLLDCCELY